MDEPTVGLDPGSRAELMSLLHAMRKERPLAVLWATHLCEEVEDADRIIVLHKGHILRDTTPAELLSSTGKTNIEDAFLSLTGKLEDAA
jgi:ABC-2 type transport system ATP-binding protein